MKTFLERLGKERLYFDGATGSFLQKRGLAGGELPERWNLLRPEELIFAAQSYLEAGCDIVTANTFGANRLRYPDKKELEAIVSAGIRCAGEARRRSGREDAFVALDLGPLGRLLEPLGDLGFEEAVGIFSEAVGFGAEAGADLVLIETMSEGLEAKAAVLAAKESCGLPVCVTMSYDRRGRLLSGGTVRSVTAMLEGLRVDALGVNCGFGPAALYPLVKELCELSSLPVIVNPNAGLPRAEGGEIVYELDAEAFAREMRPIAELGVQLLGGCCGTTPEFIGELIRETRGLPLRSAEKKRRSCVASASVCVELGRAPVLIGERINPSGRTACGEALRTGNFEEIRRLGIEQAENGAEILDVNVGLPGLNEAELMERAVKELQGATQLPLQIDTVSPSALERALRSYNGKAMINSVSGAQESMRAVFPLAAKYGGVVVALLMDEGGIPESAEERMGIAKKILAEAERYGIGREDLVFDALAMTVASEERAAAAALETVRRIRDELHALSILGISNISFGLPQRELMNACFLLLALQSGLSCAIVNPGSGPVAAAYRAFLALDGRDPGCRAFIREAASLRFAAPPAGGSAAARKAGSGETGACRELAAAVRDGLSERAREAVRKRLAEGADPMELIRGTLMPVLDDIGREFEDGKLFLPQLTMSADAAKSAFREAGAALGTSGGESRGRVLLATVRGDLHDIGKNIVKLLLENYGYRVTDLGKNVDSETILRAAREEGIRLIGLSALMTTTVAGMEETIRLIHGELPGAKVVAGGAVMTAEYARQIGADYYAADAMDTVRCAEDFFRAEGERPEPAGGGGCGL